jgi:uncharacterized repeat protein (TIGR01451 family)
MKQTDQFRRSTRMWRMAIIVLGALILSSCRSPGGQSSPSTQGQSPATGEASATNTAANMRDMTASAVMPAGYATAVSGDPAAMQEQPCPPGPLGPPGMELGVPVPYTAAGPWTPPGIVPPWPADEYLRDGGNAGPPVRVGPKGELTGLEMEDTVARFSTLDGRTLVEPSNKVSLYSPRFNAVRQVVDVEVDQQRNRATGVAEPVKPMGPRTSEPVGLNTQNLQAVRGIGTNPAVQMRSRQSQSTLFAELRPKGFDNFYRVYENLSVIRTGIYLGHEQATLARGAQAAVAWSHKQAVQIYLDSHAAGATVVSQTPQETFTIGSAPNPRLRIVKVASTAAAEPGDEVSFTIRFDNVGNQPIGSVQIVDSLTTRLEYVPDSAQCSLKANFTTQPNEGQSLVVRCVLSDPLPAGKGGVFRFRCLVR